MIKLLKCHAVSLPEVSKPIGKQVWWDMWGSYMPMQGKQKTEILMMRKVATSRKSKNHNRQKKQDTFQFVSVWLRFWRCFINNWISTKHEIPFENFVSTYEWWKGRHFYGLPRAALSLATPLCKRLVQRLSNHGSRPKCGSPRLCEWIANGFV